MRQRLVNLISYIILFLFTLFFSIYYRQSFFLVLFLLLCLLPFLSYFMARYAFKNLDVTISQKILTAKKNSTLPLNINLDNKGFLPLPHCEITLQISCIFYEKDSFEVLILPSEGRKCCVSKFPISYTKNGCYEIKLISLKSFDYLHLFSFNKPLNQHISCKIMPTLLDTFETPDTLYSEGFDEFEETTLKGNISSNVTDVREYRPGDRLQKIHWKLSAKIDDLMVKETEATSSRRFSILPELYQPKEYYALPSDSIPNAAYALDLTLDYTYALAQELLNKQESFFITWYSKVQESFLDHFIRNTDDLQAALEILYYEKPYHDEALGRTFYEAAQLKAGTLLYVTNKGVDYVTF